MAVFVEFLISTWFVIAYCVGILLFFERSRRRLQKEASVLRNALRASDNEIHEIQQTNKLDPHQLLPALDQAMATQEWARGPWSAFKATLLPPSGDESDIIRSSHTASDYFNIVTLFQERGAFAASRSVPNLLTGIGILGTFIGLAAGVGIAQDGLSSGNPDRIGASLQQLLSGASLAFLTSIAGIACSILFTMSIGRHSEHLRTEIDSWVRSLDSLVDTTTIERIASDGMNTALAELAKVSAGITRFNTDLVFALEQALDWGTDTVRPARRANQSLSPLSGRIAEHLSPQFKSIGEQMRALRDERQADAETMITNALSGFTDAMRGQAGAQFDEMAHVVANLNQALSTSTSALAASSDAAGRALQGAAGEASRELARAGSEAASSITGSTASLNEAAEQLRAAAAQNHDVFAQTATFVEKLDELRSTLEATHAGIASVAAPMRSATTAILEATEQSARTLAQTSDLVARMTGSVEEMKRHQKSVRAAWADYETRFQGVDESLKGVFQQISNGLRAYCDQVEIFVTDLDNRTASTVQHLAAATKELNDVLEDIAENPDREDPDTGRRRGQGGSS